MDANILIYSIEMVAPYSERLSPFWLAADAGRLSVVTSELSLMECLVMPFRRNDFAREWEYRDLLFDYDPMQVVPVERSILERAATLRARITGLKTPDAIHAATALIAGCDHFLTNDRGFQRVPGLPVAILDDAL